MIRAHRGPEDGAWLGTPWAGALLHFIVDPAKDLDRTAVPGWPDWASLETVLANPALRVRLGHCLVADPPGAVPEILAACATVGRRLALIPADVATTLVLLAAAWVHAPRLSALLQRGEVEAARAALGDDGFAFALGGARLLPRPAPGLEATLSRLAPVTSTAGTAWRQAGEALFGLAIGPLPQGMSARLRLRSPVALWTGVATNCLEDSQGAAAFAALERLIRQAAPRWSSWFS
jgi:hypothetical protein